MPGGASPDSRATERPPAGRVDPHGHIGDPVAAGFGDAILVRGGPPRDPAWMTWMIVRTFAAAPDGEASASPACGAPAGSVTAI
ncbi:MAG: hypothetical protein M3Y33_06555 [Actinomycetota bacterium]|nr:hypothetical protein [Actinomycetota bacterium]